MVWRTESYVLGTEVNRASISSTTENEMYNFTVHQIGCMRRNEHASGETCHSLEPVHYRSDFADHSITKSKSKVWPKVGVL